MAVNKIQTESGTVLLDLTTDTVTSEKLLSGYTAHDKSGNIITGTATAGGLKASPSGYFYEMIGSQSATNITVNLSGGNGTYTASVIYKSGSGTITPTISGSVLTIAIPSVDEGSSLNANIDIVSNNEHIYFPIDIECQCECLTGDMLITLADGTQKRIDELSIDDKVLAFDADTGNLVASEVYYTEAPLNIVKTYDHYDEYKFSDGTSIKIVHRHRFYNVEEQKMIHMDTWQIGDRAYKLGGTTPALTEINDYIPQENVRHYTIFNEHQNYFVNGLLSGNRFTKSMSKGAK